jgi:hypothetical protein
METKRPNQKLPPNVYQAELEEIDNRRSAAGMKNLEKKVLKSDEASPEHGLIGLAISGGGIRSSTFSLGVIQSLVREKVFKHFDYISTVSGGGYTGSMLSSLLGAPRPPEEPFPLTRQPGQKESFPLAKQPGQEEPLGLQHLRNGSNYLSPDDVFDKLRLPLQVIRGLLLNGVLLLPWLVLAAFVTGLWYNLNHRHQFNASSVPLPLRVALPLAGVILLSPIIARWFRALLHLKVRNFLSRAMSALLGVALLGLVLIPFDAIVSRALHASLALGDFSKQLSWVLLGREDWETIWTWWDTPGLKWGLAGLAVLVAFALRRPSAAMTKSLRELALFAVGLLGPSVLFATYVMICMVLVPSPFLPSYIQKELPTEVGKPTQITTDNLGLGMALYLKGVETENSKTGTCIYRCPDWLTTLQHASPLPWEVAPTPLQAPSLWSAVTSAWVVAPCEQSNACTAETPDVFKIQHETSEPHDTSALEVSYASYGLVYWFEIVLILVLSGIALLFTLMVIDVNYTSLHHFYRDRLSRLYLFQVRGEREVVSTDAVRLSELNEKGSAAPYHLLNVTLNLHGSDSPSLRGRKSDFFIFSKRYCGGPQTDYCLTTDLEKADPRVNLGTAMAISAAAASPNMGTMKLGSVRTLMALLNVRLGYWTPNPKYLLQSITACKLRTRLRFLTGPGSSFLLREVFGRTNASGAYVNLSDGGHLENLGVYELLRRRCEVVVAIDGEADPNMTFPSLHALMRYAWIDLGVRIELEELEQLRKSKDGTSSQHYAIGTIDYGQGRKGKFVYIKSSVSGDEHPIVANYRDEHPKFPHESTADQFFDEHQFESYRELGEHIGSQLAKDETFKALFPDEPTSLFEEKKQVHQLQVA